MRLLIEDTFATSPYTIPIASGWVLASEDLTVEVVGQLTSKVIAEETAALVPSSELLRLQQTHAVVSDVAVVADGTSSIVMRTPVRPDEVEATPVRLLEASGVAELLARVTLRPFYGIEPTAWVRDGNSPEAARAEVVIVEGAEALRDPEGGFSEDLSRAWFILTAQPVVTHVLLLPRAAPPDLWEKTLTFLGTARTEGLARRRDWLPRLADQEGIGRDRASTFWAAQRLKLDEADRQALLDLLQKGSRGTSDAPPRNIQFVDGAGPE